MNNGENWVAMEVSVPPVLENYLNQICDTLQSQGITPSCEQIIPLLKEQNYPVSAKTPRLIQYYLSNNAPNTPLAKPTASAPTTPKPAVTGTKKYVRLEASTEKPLLKKPRLDSSINAAIEASAGSSGPRFIRNVQPIQRLSHLVGMNSIHMKIKELIFQPIFMHSLYEVMGVLPTCTILLHGPSGCGKTTLANAIAGELNIPYFQVQLRIVCVVDMNR